MKAGTRLSALATDFLIDRNRNFNDIIPLFSHTLYDSYNRAYNNMALQDIRREDLEEVKLVPISQVVSRQTGVNRSHIEYYMTHKTPRELPILSKLGNKYIIEDGNHRITIALLKDEKYIKAKVSDITPYARR